MAVFDSGSEKFLGKSSAIMKSPDSKEESDIRKKKVGNYLLGKTLGEGSFAKVREGLHIISREKVSTPKNSHVLVVIERGSNGSKFVFSTANCRNCCRTMATIHNQNTALLLPLAEARSSIVKNVFDCYPSSVVRTSKLSKFENVICESLITFFWSQFSFFLWQVKTDELTLFSKCDIVSYVQ